MTDDAMRHVVASGHSTVVILGEPLSLFAGTVREVLGIDPALKMLFGISFGYREPDNPVNTFALDKAPISETVTFHRDAR